jgi:hypothetical protein
MVVGVRHEPQPLQPPRANLGVAIEDHYVVVRRYFKRMVRGTRKS